MEQCKNSFAISDGQLTFSANCRDFIKVKELQIAN